MVDALVFNGNVVLCLFDFDCLGLVFVCMRVVCLFMG